MNTLSAIGDPTGEGKLGYTFTFAESATRYYVGLIDDPTAIRVYDRTSSRYLGNLPHPNGPEGRFVRIGAIAVDSSDSLFVFDNGTKEVSAFDHRGLPGRTFRLDGLIVEKGMIPLEGNERSFLGNVIITTPERAGVPIHLFDRDGRPSMGYGDAGWVMLGYNDSKMYRWLSLDPVRGFWAAHLDEYLIERWGLKGVRPEVVIKGAPPWFQIPAEEGESKPLFVFPPPPPNLIAVRHDAGTGLLQVIGRTRDPEWRTSLTDTWIARFTRHWDGVIEVVNPQTGRLLARECFPDRLILGFLDGGRVYSLSEAAGYPQLLVEQLNFRRSENDENHEEQDVAPIGVPRAWSCVDSNSSRSP